MSRNHLVRFRRPIVWLAVAIAVEGVVPARSGGADEFIPRRQDKPPGAPLAPAEAVAKMTVPEGFQVELVASEPDIVNPVAMTFDERGRVWITESLEYPRHESGPGRDRVKILEDTDGDGRADKFTVFADGLNIPSGIAVGHGGAWVANAPDLLYLEDTDGDGRADKREVVLSGFGRSDTHELPNSLTWGPDGWLYGLNGVFNPARVKYRGAVYEFTCAMFRIHPRTRDFEVFCQGTSNPWGIAWDDAGSAFVSACVIDHLWHLTETGYYIRQGGPYPPYTAILPSIVEHKHQQAAYCGIHYFDSDAYPARYRDKLFMGNIHGNRVNVDRLERNGSTYAGQSEPDFLVANDVWFMPVVQKTGPDGCLYVLDWYDRYHCYQDASRDPRGVDRQKGRLYRVRYRDSPRAEKFDLAAESDDRLIARLGSPNVFYRDLAQRLLVERDRLEIRVKLAALALDDSAARKTRLHALWSLIGQGPLDANVHLRLCELPDPTFRAWAVRAAGNAREIDPRVRERVVALAADPAPDVRLQVAIAARKLAGAPPAKMLLNVLAASSGDELIPHIVWQNLSPLLERESGAVLDRLAADVDAQRGIAPISTLLIERIVDLKDSDATPVAKLFALFSTGPAADLAAANKCLALLAAKTESHEIGGERLASLEAQLGQRLDQLVSGASDNSSQDNPLRDSAARLAATWRRPAGLAAMREALGSAEAPVARRLAALEALVATQDGALRELVQRFFAEPDGCPKELRAAALGALGRLGASWVSTIVLANYRHLEPELKPKAIQLLTERRQWALDLLGAIGAKRLPTEALNANQVRQLLAGKDPELTALVRAQWGSIRAGRNPAREQVIEDVRAKLRAHRGDPAAGQIAFRRVCGQCHKIYGEGADVGPDVTANGRASFDQLLSNVLDPNLVIGAAYQARIVVTADGRALTGLVAEDNAQRIVLKLAGGKLETIARADVEETRLSELSMMPEELEKQFQPQELADLFAFLSLDKPPSDSAARPLPGALAARPMEAEAPERFGELLAEFGSFVTAAESGERGLGIEAEHAGRTGVLRTHPVARRQAGVLRGEVELPANKKSKLLLSVSHWPGHDWRLVVKANGRTLHEGLVGPATAPDGWQDLALDLSAFAGQKVKLELRNEPNDWNYEYAYWGRIEIVAE